MAERGGSSGLPETPMETLMRTTQASNTLAEEAMRKLVEVMKENASLRKQIADLQQSEFVDGQRRQPGLKERVEKGKLHNG